MNTGQNVSFHILAYIKLWKEIGTNNFKEKYTSEGIVFDSSW